MNFLSIYILSKPTLLACVHTGALEFPRSHNHLSRHDLPNTCPQGRQLQQQHRVSILSFPVMAFWHPSLHAPEIWTVHVSSRLCIGRSKNQGCAVSFHERADTHFPVPGGHDVGTSWSGGTGPSMRYRYYLGMAPAGYG